MNILLTSVGRRTYMVNYFKQALNLQGLVYASNNTMTYTMTQADGYVITPNIYDENYIEFLIQYCSEKNINVIIPLFDIDLPILAQHKSDFANKGIKVLVSNYEVTRICNDKWETYKFFCKNNLNCPRTYIHLTDVYSDIKNNIIRYPLILKPRWGMGSIGVYEVNNSDELNVLYEKLKRNIFTTYLKYESAIDVKNCVIIQEKILGQEYGLDILNDLHGQYVTTIAKKKIAMRSGETDVAQIVDNKIFLPVSTTIAHSLQHIVNLDLDCFVTDQQEIYLLEMNCRFGGQYPFSHCAGVDFPKQIVLWLQGDEVKESLIRPQIGVISSKDIYPVSW